MPNHRQLVEGRILILQEIISKLSSGLTKAIAEKWASENADKLADCQKRLNDIKAYYDNLYVGDNTQEQTGESKSIHRKQTQSCQLPSKN
ncbi:hypothetical protein [Spirosoma flavum]|uniref:Uncharacterized protein n=1 Tax=Spirosoma flavum TaxID=2048557 RepID=A0ABW6AJF6_9BACT